MISLYLRAQPSPDLVLSRGQDTMSEGGTEDPARTTASPLSPPSVPATASELQQGWEKYFTLELLLGAFPASPLSPHSLYPVEGLGNLETLIPLSPWLQLQLLDIGRGGNIQALVEDGQCGTRSVGLYCYLGPYPFLSDTQALWPIILQVIVSIQHCSLLSFATQHVCLTASWLVRTAREGFSLEFSYVKETALLTLWEVQGDWCKAGRRQVWDLWTLRNTLEAF